MNDIQEVLVQAHVDQTEIDEMVQKFERIRDLMREANSLSGELASKEKTIRVSFECGD